MLIRKLVHADFYVIFILQAVLQHLKLEGTDYADLKMVDELNVEEYGVAFRKGSDVPDAVNTAFDELKADGTMQALADKYGLTLAD